MLLGYQIGPTALSGNPEFDPDPDSDFDKISGACQHTMRILIKSGGGDKPPRDKPRGIILLGFIIQIEIGIAIEIETI